MSKAKKHLDNYQKFLSKGQIPKAIDALESVVQLMPKDVNHRKKLADLYHRAKRGAEAFSTYEVVAREFAEGGFNLKAIAIYRQMQKIDPTQPLVYEQLADLNMKQGLTGQALSVYGELVDILEKSDRRAESAEILVKMAKLDPSNVGVRIRVAESYCRSGEKEKGLEELNEVSKELRKKGDMKTLRNLYELFLRQFPDDLSIQAGMARSLISSGDPDRALQLLQGLLKKAPDNVDVLGNLANAYRATKDHENERLTFKQLIKHNPDLLDFHKGYARACLDAGEPEKALEHLEENKEMFSGLNHQKALASYYEKMHEMLEGNPRIVETLKELYTTTGQESRLADLESKVDQFEDEGFAGFDQEPEELAPLEEAEELEPLEEIEEVEELEELEEVEELETLEEVEEFEELGESEELGAAGDFDASGFESSDESDGYLGDGTDFGGFDVDDASLGLADEEPASAPALSAEEVEALDVPIEEEVLDLEMEIEFDADAGSGTDEVEAVESIEEEPEEELSLDEDLDLDMDLDEEFSVEEDGEIDLDVEFDADAEDITADDLSLDVEDAGIEPELESGDDEDLGLEADDGLDLDLDLSAEQDAETGVDDGLTISGVEGIDPDDLDLDLEGSILDATGDVEAAVEDEAPSEFLETGMDALEEMQASIEADIETGQDEKPQRNLVTELEEAEFYVQQGLYDEAEGVCRALEEDFPGAPEIAAKLDYISSHRAEATEKPAAEEDDFFDLASEISNESVFEAGEEMESLDERDLSRLDGILNEFKKGIESQIDKEDTETHFNLGIAYKEMGLLDDAIGEFERVMVDPNRVVDCLTLVGICQAEKGDFAQAEETFKRGIETPESTDEDQLTLNYELGIIYEALGRPDDAINCFRYVADRQPGFRDVDSKLSGAPQSSDDDDSGNGSAGSGGDSRISFV